MKRFSARVQYCNTQRQLISHVVTSSRSTTSFSTTLAMSNALQVEFTSARSTVSLSIGSKAAGDDDLAIGGERANWKDLGLVRKTDHGSSAGGQAAARSCSSSYEENQTSRRTSMHRSSILTCVFAGLLASLLLSSASASAQEVTKLSELVSGMPKGDKQQIRVLTATVEPGGKTVFHTHRFPVSLYILEGAFTLELEGRPPVTVRAGEAMVEPPHVKMIGYNRSTTEPMRVVTFYVSDLDTPFLDPIH
jgi:quercetin dioxygenase-like cupin family protein